MATLIEVKVPDIGDFQDVPIIEVIVKPGDQLTTEDAMITLESDKATMDVPAPAGGIVREIMVKVGDRVSEGSLILILESNEVEPTQLGREKVKEDAASTAEDAPSANYGSPSGVYEVIEVHVPGIGDFKDVPIIEIFVKPGDPVKLEDLLITLESDKATMEVPSVVEGTVKDVMVGLGDRVSEGSLILTVATEIIETASARPTLQGAGPDAALPATSKPSVPQYPADVDIECDVMVLGAGPGGYSAAFRSADLGLKTVLVERYPTLGGVCLNVGCIPSKALLHVSAVADEAQMLTTHGLSFGKLQLDLDALRGWKNEVVGKLTGGLAGMAKTRKVQVVQGLGKLLDPNHLHVSLPNNGGAKIIRFQKAIIAAGSQPLRLPFVPDDPRIIDSTGALALEFIPKRMLIIGGGIIGLEMATVYSTLGSRIDVVEMLDGLMTGADRDLVKVWGKKNSGRFEKIMLKTKTVSAEVNSEGVSVKFEGTEAPSEPQLYDLVLVAVGRTPNGKKIGAENAGVAITERGFLTVDKQMRTNVPNIFAIGDITGQPMLAHKAVHEGHVAAEAAAGYKTHFDARQIPSVAYTDPEIAWAGVTEEECKANGTRYSKAIFPWAASGRAMANGRDEGFTKLLFDMDSHRVIGGGIVGTHAGDLIGEVCLAVEMGCDAVDLGKTIHPHPTLCESIGMAAELFEGICTDLLPAKKK
jgi:dihydrolipoamide dehydrogenase